MQANARTFNVIAQTPTLENLAGLVDGSADDCGVSPWPGGPFDPRPRRPDTTLWGFGGDFALRRFWMPKRRLVVNRAAVLTPKGGKYNLCDLAPYERGAQVWSSRGWSCVALQSITVLATRELPGAFPDAPQTATKALLHQLEWGLS